MTKWAHAYFQAWSYSFWIFLEKRKKIDKRKFCLIKNVSKNFWRIDLNLNLKKNFNFWRRRLREFGIMMFEVLLVADSDFFFLNLEQLFEFLKLTLTHKSIVLLELELACPLIFLSSHQI